LLQCVAFSAFFLDGFAHVTESFVGEAKGMRDRGALDAAVRFTSQVATLCALLLAAGLWFFGSDAIRILTSLPEVRGAAEHQVIAIVVYVGLSVIAFQLDGIFIGATATGPLRNAALLSALGFLVVAQGAIPLGGNTGLWWSFVFYVALRGLSLSILFVRLRRTIFSS
jgi:MATE family multidrug resistance protein